MPYRVASPPAEPKPTWRAWMRAIWVWVVCRVSGHDWLAFSAGGEPWHTPLLGPPIRSVHGELTPEPVLRCSRCGEQFIDPDPLVIRQPPATQPSCSDRLSEAQPSEVTVGLIDLGIEAMLDFVLHRDDDGEVD